VRAAGGASPLRSLLARGAAAGLALLLAAGAPGGGALALAHPSATAAPAPPPTVMRLPASDNPEVLAAQQTMVQSWAIVRDAFVDGGAVGGPRWDAALRAHMAAAYAAADGAAAFSEIGELLSEVGDPYTRIIGPEEYSQFRVSSEGSVQARHAVRGLGG